MKRNHGYIILWGSWTGLLFLIGSTGGAGSEFCYSPVTESSPEIRSCFGHLLRWSGPHRRWRIIFGVDLRPDGPWPEVWPFANFRAKTKSTRKRKKEPQTSVHQRLRFYSIEFSHLSSFRLILHLSIHSLK